MFNAFQKERATPRVIAATGISCRTLPTCASERLQFWTPALFEIRDPYRGSDGLSYLTGPTALGFLSAATAVTGWVECRITPSLTTSPTPTSRNAAGGIDPS